MRRTVDSSNECPVIIIPIGMSDLPNPQGIDNDGCPVVLKTPVKNGIWPPPPGSVEVGVHSSMVGVGIGTVGVTIASTDCIRFATS